MNFSKKKALLTLAVIELAALLFAGHRVSTFNAQPRLPRTFVPVESMFPELHRPEQFVVQVPAPVVSKGVLTRPAPHPVGKTYVVARAPKPLM